MRFGTKAALLLLAGAFLASCSPEEQAQLELRPAPPADQTIHGFVDGCYTMDASAPDSERFAYLAPTEDGESFEFVTTDEAEASRFYLKASDLATYVFYDSEEQYFVAKEGVFERKSELSSSLIELDDDFKPGAQWEVEAAEQSEGRFKLKHRASGQYLTMTGLADDPGDAVTVTFYPAEGCADYPSLSLDAEGEVEPRQWDDGSVYGFVETHSHIMSNFGFGGAGIFHGAPFHPLGPHHALPSCKMFHGEEGRQDLFGYGFDQGNDLEENDLLTAMVSGRTPEPNHATEGYPVFTDWPNAHSSSTHQTQYYKWIQRAYLGGLRLMVQHATTNQIICELLEGSDTQPTRYSCNDMVAVDRILKETKKMERYIDAQSGGPGEGWFRIVESPAEAREVINNGKMAVVLGIETSNLFDCFLVPPDGEERCTEQDVIDKLDEYHDRGVRAIFPVHKYDNGFSAGDGDRVIIELGNFGQTGHYGNFTTDCPDVPARFDRGDVNFGGLNDPRDDYFAEPPVDMSTFGEEPIDLLLQHVDKLTDGSLEGDYCQNHGLTNLGEFLIQELMSRGMIIEVDHLPQRSYKRAYDILGENDYPAAGTHGGHFNGKIYELGGVSKFNFGNCADPDNPGSRASGLEQRLALMEDAGKYRAEGFGFDLNGFAGAPGPRFGENSVCDQEQQNPVTYPFESHNGDVTFTQPQLADRTPDFNTEGLVHIGMVPELIQDVRNTGVTDEQLEPLFRSGRGLPPHVGESRATRPDVESMSGAGCGWAAASGVTCYDASQASTMLLIDDEKTRAQAAWMYRDMTKTIPRLLCLLILFLPACSPGCFLAPGDEFDVEKVPTPPDYGERTSWAALPDKDDNADLTPPGVEDRQDEATADVFFIHPTTFFDRSRWNDPLDYEKSRTFVDQMVMSGQASAFNGCCRVYAPRYRQATIGTYFADKENAEGAFGTAFSDIERAFEVFLEDHNDGRPFILASHSQGSQHAMRLLERIDVDEDVRARMIAAYIPGFSHPMSRFDEVYDHLEPCRLPRQVGCVAAWDTYREGADAEIPDKAVYWRAGSLVAVAPSEPRQCTNPISWRMSDEKISKERHDGAVKPVYPDGELSFYDILMSDEPLGFEVDALSEPRETLLNAQCKEQGLRVPDLDELGYSATETTPGNYHLLDYRLFYMDIRQNAVERTEAWLERER